MTEPQQPTEEQMSTLRQISSWLLKPRSIQLKEKKDQKQQYVTDLALLPKDLKSSDFIKSKDGMVIHAPNSAKLPTLFRDRRDYLLYNNYASHAGITTLFDFCETLSAPVAALYGGPFQKRLFELIKISTDEVKALVTVKENEIPLVTANENENKIVAVSTSRFPFTILRIVVISFIWMVIYFRNNHDELWGWIWAVIDLLLSGIMNVWFIIRYCLFVAAWFFSPSTMYIIISVLGATVLLAVYVSIPNATEEKRKQFRKIEMWIYIILVILVLLAASSHLIREDSPELEEQMRVYQNMWHAKGDILNLYKKAAKSKSDIRIDLQYFGKAYTPNFNASVFETVKEVPFPVIVNTTIQLNITGEEEEVIVKVPVSLNGTMFFNITRSERIVNNTVYHDRIVDGPASDVSCPAPEIKIEYQDREVPVPQPCPDPPAPEIKIEYIDREVPVPQPYPVPEIKIEYIDREVLVPRTCPVPETQYKPEPEPEPYHSNDRLVNTIRYIRERSMIIVSFITGIIAHKAGAEVYANRYSMVVRRRNLRPEVIISVIGLIMNNWNTFGTIAENWNVFYMIGTGFNRLLSLWG